MNVDRLREWMLHIEDEQERERLLQQAWRYNGQVPKEEILTCTNHVHRLLQAKQIDSLSQLDALQRKGTRAWLLQGVHLYLRGSLSFELFIKISMSVTELSLPMTLQLLQKVHEVLYQDVKQAIESRWYNRYNYFNFYSIKQFELDQARNQHEWRCDFNGRISGPNP
jgi:hypothetical protein